VALDQDVEHVAVLIDGPPEIVQFAANPHEHLIEKLFVPGPRPAPLEALGISSPDAQTPFTDGLVVDLIPRAARINSTSRRLRLKQCYNQKA
jgi:hypothetical protein